MGAAGVFSLHDRIQPFFAMAIHGACKAGSCHLLVRKK
jgi:hypothetical protein